MRRAALSLIPALGLLAAAACSPPAPVDPVLRPRDRPDRAEMAPEPRDLAIRPRSPESLLLAEYYRRVEDGLVTQGLLRRDPGGRDTPFDADRLARTFERVALYQEYDTASGSLVARETPSQLHRWERPIRIEARFGPSVSPVNRLRDKAALSRYAARLARVTGHPIEMAERNGNFTVYFVSEDDRRALGTELQRLSAQISGPALRSVIDLPRSSYCVVLAIDPDDSGRYTRAVAIIRAEHPDLLRLSCIHEEVAQGLGLSNDTPIARPSVFNDDEEFALLTTHDEYLLRMLYDPRLRPGMSIEEARPIVRQIARELLPDT